jgi:hypothetical protein
MKRFSFLICLFLLLLLVPGGLAVVDTPPPRISSVSPSSAPNTGSMTFTITGSDFVPGIRANFKPCFSTPITGTVTFVSSSELRATFNLNGVTPSPTGKIFVYNPDGDQSNPFLDIAVYGPSSTGTTTTSTGTTTVTTTITESEGKNSIFLETNPSGATIFIDGDEVGTSASTYHTDLDGTFNVVAKKIGYEDYEGKVTVVEGQRAHFYALLTPLASGGTAATPGAASSAGPVKTTATIKTTTTTWKSTLKIPTPLGTDPPLTEESPADPAIVLLAAGIAIVLVVIRRR